MPRPPDETIPDDEELYRPIAADHCEPDGDRVREGAVDTRGRGTSFYRSAYCPLDRVPPHTGCSVIAALIAGDLPSPVVTPGNVAWEFFLVDDPNEHHEAHVEVRYRRQGSTNRDGDRIPSGKSATKLAIREALAEKLRVKRRLADESAEVQST